MFPFKVIGLREERLVHIKCAVKLPVLVPFVLAVVDLVVCVRSCEMQLPPKSSVVGQSGLFDERAPFTSFGAIRIMSPVPKPGQFRNQKRSWQRRGLTILLMQVRAQGRQTHTPNKLHVCKPPPRACCTTRSGEARKGMKVDVIDDAEEAIE